jgi:hypothetical protein
MRGTGSSFAVVTRLTLRMLDTSRLSSALNVVSLDLSRPKEAAAALQAFLSSFPHAASVTLFGLDAWLKAAAFQLRFASNKARLLLELIKSQSQSQRQSRGSAWVHFVSEVSWALGTYSLPALEADSTSFFSRRSNNTSDKARARDRGEAAMETGTWSLVGGYGWDVASYDLVWGSGHAYAGASIGCSQDGQGAVTEAFLTQFAQHLVPPAAGAQSRNDSKACSDCVAVLHRVGPGLRQAAGRNVHLSSVNPAVAQAALWVEMDCGVFARHAKRLPSCSAFVDRTQLALERACAEAGAGAGEEGACFHYPNVPSLASTRWRELYFGADETEAVLRLERAKQLVDPSNLLSHAQSLWPSTALPRGAVGGDVNGGRSRVKRWACTAAFWSARLRDARRAVKAALYAKTGWAGLAGGRGEGNAAEKVLRVLRGDLAAVVATFLAIFDAAFFIARRAQGVW